MEMEYFGNVYMKHLPTLHNITFNICNVVKANWTNLLTNKKLCSLTNWEKEKGTKEQQFGYKNVSKIQD